MYKNSVIIIPARLASSRLPNKPLADINGKPMIVRVYEQCKKTDVSQVIVACAEQEIKKAVEKSGGMAVLTDPTHPSGTDRIYEAFTKMSGIYDYVINVQGDLPFLEPQIIDAALSLLKNNDTDIGTVAAKIINEPEKSNPNIVKPIISFFKHDEGRALYFTRSTAPYGEGDLYHHIGIYAYKTRALKKFVNLQPSQLEEREKLEQLRALENNMRIDIKIVDTVPITVDTPADLEFARSYP